MSGINDALAWLDNKRKVVATNVSDVLRNPRDAIPMQATRAAEQLTTQFQDPMNAIGHGMGGGVGVIKGVLKRDNPGGSWLAGKLREAAESGVTEFGAPKRFGAVTGNFTEHQNIPVETLAKIKGLRGEQGNVRQQDLDSLVEYMGANKKLPPGSRPGKEYAPYVEVDQNGIPWVNEGNHRIMAAQKLGWQNMPVEVRYFNGGENVQGVLSPSNIEKFPDLGRFKP